MTKRIKLALCAIIIACSLASALYLAYQYGTDAGVSRGIKICAGLLRKHCAQGVPPVTLDQQEPSEYDDVK